jgi:hypothetical protein
VTNQKANAPDKPRAQKDTWSITVNGAEIREITVAKAVSGDPLVWKIAMWGSALDLKLLRSVEGRFDSLQVVRKRLGLQMNQGVEFESPTTGVYVKELVDKNTVDMNSLRDCGPIYSFPQSSLKKIGKDKAYLRQGRADLPVRVSRPPHVIVDAARRLAVYSDTFIAVPARCVGIAGTDKQGDLLKALSVFLSSDFAMYHQFLTSPQLGIFKSIADLKNLKQLPCPIDGIQRGGLARWSKLHAALVRAASKTKPARTEPTLPLYPTEEPADDVARLEAELNGMVNDALNLHESDTWLVSDLVNVRRRFIQGKVDPDAVAPPSSEEMRQYCEALKGELDSFIEVVTDERHLVEVVHQQESAMIVVHRAPARSLRGSIQILPATAEGARAFGKIRQKLLRKDSQWLYFERALRCYLNGNAYLFKPMQRLHWLRSQALIDAGEIIADTAGGGGA